MKRKMKGKFSLNKRPSSVTNLVFILVFLQTSMSNAQTKLTENDDRALESNAHVDVLPQCQDEACVVEAAREMLQTGQHEQALTYLKEQKKRWPQSGPVQVLLGIAYLKNENAFWAVKVLSGRLEQDPTDCDARHWLAWTYLRLVSVDDAIGILAQGNCSEPEMEGRTNMMRALVYHYDDKGDDARSALAEARRRDELFAADRDVLALLTAIVKPEHLTDLGWRLETSIGYTSNALLGSPLDPTARGVEPGSALLTVDAWFRYTPDFDLGLRPTLELQPKVLRFFSEDAEELSYLSLSGRVGFYLDFGLPRLLFGYRPEYTLISKGDRYDSGPVWYYAAHRGELEIEVANWLLVFAGAGAREFREQGRSRTEVDGGFGGFVPIIPELALLWAVSGRGYWSQDEAYNLGGLSAILNLQVNIPYGMWAHVGATVAADWFPDSAGSIFGEEARHDLFFKAGAAFWSPSLYGVRLGLSYDYSDRDSTTDDYSFSDHRVLLRIRWTGSIDSNLPDTSSKQALYDIDWGLSGSGGSNERIQDLLRQEEQLSRDCGCSL